MFFLFILALAVEVATSTSSSSSSCPVSPPLEPCSKLQCFLSGLNVSLPTLPPKLGVSIANASCAQLSVAAVHSLLEQNDTAFTLEVDGVEAQCVGLLVLPVLGTHSMTFTLGSKSSVMVGMEWLINAGSVLPVSARVTKSSASMDITKLNVGSLKVPSWALPVIDDLVDGMASQTLSQTLSRELNALVLYLDGIAKSPPPPYKVAPSPDMPIVPLNDTWVSALDQFTHRLQAPIGRAFDLLENATFPLNGSALPIETTSSTSPSCVWVAPLRVSVPKAQGLYLSLSVRDTMGLETVFGGDALVVVADVLVVVASSSSGGPALALNMSVQLSVTEGFVSSKLWLGVSREWISNITYILQALQFPGCLFPVTDMAGLSFEFRSALITSTLSSAGTGVDHELFQLLNNANAFFVAGYSTALPRLITTWASGTVPAAVDSLLQRVLHNSSCPAPSSMLPPAEERYDYNEIFPLNPLWLAISLACCLVLSILLVLLTALYLRRVGSKNPVSWSFCFAVLFLVGSCALFGLGMGSNLAWITLQIESPQANASMATPTLKQFSFTGLVVDNWNARAYFNSVALIAIGVVLPVLRNVILLAFLGYSFVKRPVSTRLLRKMQLAEYTVSMFVVSSAIL